MSRLTTSWGLACLCFFAAIASLRASEADEANATSAPSGPSSAVVQGPRWKLELEDGTYDFGTVWAGVDVEYPFRFTNIGNEVLIISEPQSRCACSVSENYTRQAPPGGSGIIPFVLKTGAKSGLVKEALFVPTNDPVTPKMIVRLTGLVRTVCKTEVIADDAVRPGTADFADIKHTAASFGRITSDQKLHRVIKMENTTGAPLSLKVKAVIPSGSPFEAEVKETVKGETFELIVTGKPPFSPGYTNASILFDTNIVDHPGFKLSTSAYVPPRVEVVPQKIIIDPRFPPVPIRMIKVTNNGESHFEITSIAASHPEFDLRLLPVHPTTPNTFDIKLKLPMGRYRPPEYGDVVRITTSHPESPVIDIYVLPKAGAEPSNRPADQPLVFHPGKMQ